MLIVLICALFLRLKGDICAIAGLAAASIAALTYFHTESIIVWKSILAGILTSLPITLLVGTSMFQAFFMERVGAFNRITIAMKNITSGDDMASVAIINIGIAGILSWFGINPLCILPLLLIGMGYSTYAAIALPAIGTAMLFIYSFCGEGLETFFLHLGGGQTFDQSAYFFVDYTWYIAFIGSLGIFYLSGKTKSLPQAVIPSAVIALVIWASAKYASMLGISRYTGIIAGIAVIVSMLLWSFIRRRKSGVDQGHLTEDDVAKTKQMPLATALLPLILSALCISVVLLVTPLKLSLTDLWRADVELFPAERLWLRPLTQPYFWILVATLICIPTFKGWRDSLPAVFSKWTKAAPRPMLASALFFAAGVVMMNSGHPDMLRAFQDFCAALFKDAYPYFGVVAGLRMGFLTGSMELPIEMLTRIHLEITEFLMSPGGAGTFTAAGSAIAASIAVMVNPGRLMNASALIGKTGMEGRVLRSTFVLALLSVVGIGIITLIKAWA